MWVFNYPKGTRGPLTTQRIYIQGATDTKPYPQRTTSKVGLGRGTVTHSFIVIPECPFPLLGCDLMYKLRAQIIFKDDAISIDFPQKRISNSVIFVTPPLGEGYLNSPEEGAPKHQENPLLEENQLKF